MRRRPRRGAVLELRVLGIRNPNKMLKASNIKAPGFSLGFGMCNLLRAESTPEGLNYDSGSIKKASLKGCLNGKRDTVGLA